MDLPQLWQMQSDQPWNETKQTVSTEKRSPDKLMIGYLH